MLLVSTRKMENIQKWSYIPLDNFLKWLNKQKWSCSFEHNDGELIELRYYGILLLFYFVDEWLAIDL